MTLKLVNGRKHGYPTHIGFLSAGSAFEGVFDLDGGHCKASDVTWELEFQLLSGGQKMELFEDEKASPEGFVGEVTILKAHR